MNETINLIRMGSGKVIALLNMFSLSFIILFIAFFAGVYHQNIPKANACDKSECGNEIIEVGEQCDDGNTQNGDGCSSSCAIEPMPIICPINPQEGRKIVNIGGMIRSDKTEAEAKSSLIYTLISQGKYNITLASYDDHANKPNQKQPGEMWHLLLMNAAQSIISTTPSISDLANNDNYIIEQVASGFSILEDVAGIIAYHSAYYDSNPNSIVPLCAGFDSIEEPAEPTLTVNKMLIPSDDQGLFNLLIDSSMEASDIGDGGTTRAVTLDAGTYTVSETAGTGTDLAGYVSVIGGDCQPDGSITLEAGQNAVCTITNTKKTETNTVTVVATKIVCNDESLLPNWGEDGVQDGEPDMIDASTAIDYVAQHEGCGLAQGWSFQWGDHTAIKKAGDFYGPANDPADNWTTIDNPTDSGGNTLAIINIDNITSNPKRLWLREVLQEGYIPFTYPPNDDHFSAEFYCSSDILNYDNYDFIVDPQVGETYYCAAFNAQIRSAEPTLTVNKMLIPSDDQGLFNLLIDSSMEASDIGDGGTTRAVTLDAGTYTVSETAGTGTDLAGYVSVIGGDCQPDGSITLEAGQNAVCTITNTKKTETNTVTVVATKIVCNDESLLPNWGEDGVQDGEPDMIDASTAIDYVAQHEGCGLAQGWSFQWGDQDVNNPGDDLFGEAGAGWEIFGTTSGNGTVSTEIDIDNFTQLRLREVLKEGYISFKYYPTENNDDHYSAEFYCSNNIENYDNFDFIDELTVGKTYYCAAFNALKEITPAYQCSDGIDNDGDTLIDTNDPGCHSDGDAGNTGSYVPTDNDETDTPPPPPVYQCSDTFDNDQDGYIDILDPTCHSDGDATNSGSYLPNRNNEKNNAPTVSLTTASLSINAGNTFDPLGGYATANDVEDGDITSKITVSGSVNTNIAGIYHIDYDVVDSENEPAQTKTLEITVVQQGCISNCGGGGGSAVIIKLSIIITDEKVEYLGEGEALVTWKTNIETTEQVVYGDNSISALGASPKYGYDSVNTESIDMKREHSVIIRGLTDGVIYYFRPVADRNGSTGEVVGKEVYYQIEKGEVKGEVAPVPVPSPCNYLLEYIKLGINNNPIEVEKLELFLNEFEGENLPINGIYEKIDFGAVSRFQEKYMSDVLSPWSYNKATGYVYITTKKKINEIYCEREFPLTEQQQAEIAIFSGRFSGIGNVRAPKTDDSKAVPAPSEEENQFMKPEIQETGRVEGKSASTENSSGENIGEENDASEQKQGQQENIVSENEVNEMNQDAEKENDSNNFISSLYKLIIIIVAIISIIGLSYYAFRLKKKNYD